MDISHLRTDYKREALDEAHADADPVRQFSRWWDEAIASKLPEPNAMTLATASPTGEPSARIVLLKGIDERGFVFYTNYESAKGRDLAANPRATLSFYWPQLERQVRIAGSVERVSPEESRAYFDSRPLGSRLALRLCSRRIRAGRGCRTSRPRSVRAASESSFGCSPTLSPTRWTTGMASWAARGFCLRLRKAITACFSAARLWGG